jgi:hypothetical protein
MFTLIASMIAETTSPKIFCVSNTIAYGHLGMVMTPNVYAHLSATGWTDTVHPGPIAHIPAGTAQHQASHLRDIHNQTLGIVQLADTVKTLIIRQIKNAIEEDYLADEANTTTGMFNDTLTTTIQKLFTKKRFCQARFRRNKIARTKRET